MPGAPNRPPEVAAPPPPPRADDPAARVVRRLAPSRVSLRLDLWRPSAPKELVEALAAAEAKFVAGDLRGAESALDQFAVRLAEPRWPTLPEPFKELRVRIPAPQPPHYDPEFTLTPADREARRLAREAATQLALAKACLAWAGAHAVALPGDFATELAAAESELASGGPTERFWAPLDRLWTQVRGAVPMPGAAATPTPAPPPPDGADAPEA